MPQIRFPANYPLPPSQAALLADPNDLPGFNPTDDPSQQDPGIGTVSAGDPTPIPPSPSTVADAENANTVGLPSISNAPPKMAPTRNGTPPPPVDDQANFNAELAKTQASLVQAGNTPPTAAPQGAGNQSAVQAQ